MERAVSAVAADYRRPAGPVVTAAVLAVAAGLESARAAGPLRPHAALLLGLLATAPIALIRKYPALAIGIVLAASAAFVMLGRLSWSVAAVAGWLLALAACPLLLGRRQAVLALALTQFAVLLGTAKLHGNVTPWDATAAEFLAVLAAWGAGEMLRARREAAAERAATTERVRLLSERHIVATERASMARELHDVVAHHVSLIAVRAATARYSVPGLSEPGHAAFAEIADEARTALTELRMVLGVLRSPDGDGAAVAPQPAMRDLDGLLSRFTAAGTVATMTVCGVPRKLPASVELCCYRIVQEALTNAGRHAPGRQVRVELRYAPESIGVRVANDGTAGRPVRLPAGHVGFGLTGLRERVAILGGDFRAGPQGAGGFAVSAVLPADGAAAGDAG
jgi:signal transduction histidine kinase